MKKYFQSALRYFAVYLCGFLAFAVVSFLVNAAFNLLCEWFPAVFRKYDFISEEELAESLSQKLKLTCGIISVFLLEIIAVKYDNARYEYLISQTDGFYTIKSGARLYISEYLYADILSSVLVPITTFWMIFIRIGEAAPKFLKFMAGYLNSFLAVPLSFAEKYGIIYGILLLILTSLLSRVPAIWLGLRRWRAVWLSDIGKESLR